MSDTLATGSAISPITLRVNEVLPAPLHGDDSVRLQHSLQEPFADALDISVSTEFAHIPGAIFTVRHTKKTVKILQVVEFELLLTPP